MCLKVTKIDLSTLSQTFSRQNVLNRLKSIFSDGLTPEERRERIKEHPAKYLTVF